MADAKHQWYLSNTEHQKARVRSNHDRTTADNHSKAWEYLAAHPCVDCGETDPIVLQFDHVAEKRRDISEMVRAGFSWPAIESEIARCQVRCGNCHRRKTAREQGIHDRKHSFMKLEDALGLYRWFDN